MSLWEICINKVRLDYVAITINNKCTWLHESKGLFPLTFQYYAGSLVLLGGDCPPSLNYWVPPTIKRGLHNCDRRERKIKEYYIDIFWPARKWVYHFCLYFIGQNLATWAQLYCKWDWEMQFSWGSRKKEWIGEHLDLSGRHHLEQRLW